MIFYFTGTGNSYHAAMSIGEELGHEIIDISNAAAKKDFTYKLAVNEAVGFVFPVYYYGMPTIVEDFIKNLSIDAETVSYSFAVLTCGDSIGAADQQLRKLLNDKKVDLTAVFSLAMVDNFIFGYDLKNESEQSLALSKADKRLKTIIKSIQVRGTSDKPSTVFDRLLTGIAYPFYRRGRKTKKFYADDKCISCDLCQDICPSAAIKMTDGKPEWIKDQCIHCCACINRCPVQAIQYGTSTRSRRRYIHPVLK